MFVRKKKGTQNYFFQIFANWKKVKRVFLDVKNTEKHEIKKIKNIGCTLTFDITI